MPDIAIKKLETGHLSLDTSVLRDTDLDAGKIEDDIFSSERLEGLAGAQIDRKLAEITLDTGSLALDVDLEEARRLIDRKQYERALEILTRVLKASRDSHEARYLKASCHAKMQDYLETLEELAVLRRADVGDKIRTLHRQLLAQTRRVLPPTMLLETALRITAGDTAALATKLERLVKLDPEPYVYHFLLAGAQMKAGDNKGARRAVERGLSEGSFGDDGPLRSLNEELLKRSLLDDMQTARQHFRQGHYAEAREHLASLPSGYNELKLYRVFDGYLQRLVAARSAARRADVVPAGSFREVDALYSYLVGNEVRSGKKALESEDFLSAVESLDEALSVCPRYPFANFLYAVANFKWLAEQFRKDAPPELESAHSVLETSRVAARLGCEDEDVRPTALALLGAIESALDSLPNPADVALVNELISEYNDIDSSDGLEDVHRRLQNLERRLNSEGDSVQDPKARQAIGQLREAVASALGSLPDPADVELVNDLLSEFNDIMKSTEKATDPDGLKAVLRRLHSLKRRLDGEGAYVADPKGQDTVSQLKDAVDSRLIEIQGVLDRADQSKAVGELVGDFNTCAKALQQAVEKGEFELVKRLFEHLGTLRSRVVSEQSHNSNPQLAELLQAIDRFTGNSPKDSGKKSKRGRRRRR